MLIYQYNMKQFLINVSVCLQIILSHFIKYSDYYMHQIISRRYHHKKTTLLRMNCPYIAVSIDKLGKNNYEYVNLMDPCFTQSMVDEDLNKVKRFRWAIYCDQWVK